MVGGQDPLIVITSVPAWRLVSKVNSRTPWEPSMPCRLGRASCMIKPPLFRATAQSLNPDPSIPWELQRDLGPMHLEGRFGRSISFQRSSRSHRMQVEIRFRYASLTTFANVQSTTQIPTMLLVHARADEALLATSTCNPGETFEFVNAPFDNGRGESGPCSFQLCNRKTNNGVVRYR